MYISYLPFTFLEEYKGEGKAYEETDPPFPRNTHM